MVAMSQIEEFGRRIGHEFHPERVSWLVRTPESGPFCLIPAP